MTKDFKTQLKGVQKKHEEEVQSLRKEAKKTKQETKDKLQKEVQAQVSPSGHKMDPHTVTPSHPPRLKS